MYYSVSHYGLALKEALKGKSEKERKEILKRFLLLLRKNHAGANLVQILQKYEYFLLKESGLSKVVIESTDSISAEMRREINKAMGGKAALREKINPKLLGGITILINDEVLIDASASHQLEKLFARV